MKEKELQLRENQKYAFIVAVISMLVAHFYFYANRFICYEDLVNSFVPRNIYSIGALDHGRWFLPVAQAFSSNWSLPPVSGVVSAIVFGLIVVVLIQLFQIENRILCMLLAAVLTTFPTVACYNEYTHQAESFIIALFLATLAVYVVEKYRFGFLLGALLLCFSMGIYQVFVSFAVALIYVILLLRCLDQEFTIKELFHKVWPYVLMLGLGAVGYVVTTKVLLAMTGIEMVSYHNANQALTVSNINIAIGIKPMILVFVQYFFTTVYNSSYVLVGMHLVAMIICAIMIINRMKHNAKSKCWIQNILILLLLAVMPLGINSLPILLGNAALNGNGLRRYMFYSLVVLYILFVVIVDRMIRKEEFSVKVHRWTLRLTICILLGVIWGGFIQANQAYSRANTVYQSVYGYMNRILARVEMMEEYEPSMPVYFANCNGIFSDYYKVDIPEFDNLFDMEPLQLQKMYDQKTMVNFWRIYLHMQVVSPTEEQMESIKTSEQFQNMKAYPGNDSIQIMDGVLVIKMSE